MNYIRIKALPSAEKLIQRYPLSETGHEKIMRDRLEIKAILEGRDPRLLIVVGPCSAWPDEAVLAYAHRLASVSQRVQETLKIVMRMYVQKPRTITGWAGPIHQPDPFSPPDIEAGMTYVRQMMVKVIEMGLPIADECLFTHHAKSLNELVSWLAIGARSSEDHEHRIFASSANCPVGMKNPTHGSLTVAVNSVIAAQHPHVAAIDGYEVQTLGNAHAHLVLRGANQSPNYSVAHLKEVRKLLLDHSVKNPAVMIDVSHDNCMMAGKKDPMRQPEMIFNILHDLSLYPELSYLVKGFMIESYLKAGAQKLEACTPETIDLDGLSITDPCLGWNETEQLLDRLHELRSL